MSNQTNTKKAHWGDVYLSHFGRTWNNDIQRFDTFEEWWQGTEYIENMLQVLHSKKFQDEQVLHVLSFQCAQRVVGLIEDTQARDALMVVDMYNHGKVPYEELLRAGTVVIAAMQNAEWRTVSAIACQAIWAVVRETARVAATEDNAIAWCKAKDDNTAWAAKRATEGKGEAIVRGWDGETAILAAWDTTQAAAHAVAQVYALEEDRTLWGIALRKELAAQANILREMIPVERLTEVSSIQNDSYSWDATTAIEDPQTSLLQLF